MGPPHLGGRSCIRIPESLFPFKGIRRPPLWLSIIGHFFLPLVSFLYSHLRLYTLEAVDSERQSPTSQASSSSRASREYPLQSRASMRRSEACSGTTPADFEMVTSRSPPKLLVFGLCLTSPPTKVSPAAWSVARLPPIDLSRYLLGARPYPEV